MLFIYLVCRYHLIYNVSNLEMIVRVDIPVPILLWWLPFLNRHGCREGIGSGESNILVLFNIRITCNFLVSKPFKMKFKLSHGY